MGFVRDNTFYHLDMKKQLVKLLQDGFADLFNVTEENKPYGPHIKKIDVFRRDPVIRKVGEIGKEIPCVGINRIADGEANQFLGEINNEGTTGNFVKGRYFSEVFEIRVWAQNPELRDDIYNDVKRIILTGKEKYIENIEINEDGEEEAPFGSGGGLIVRFLTGVDEADHNFFPGHPMYWGTIHLAIINPFLYEGTEEHETIVDIETQ